MKGFEKSEHLLFNRKEWHSSLQTTLTLVSGTVLQTDTHASYFQKTIIVKRCVDALFNVLLSVLLRLSTGARRVCVLPKKKHRLGLNSQSDDDSTNVKLNSNLIGERVQGRD